MIITIEVMPKEGILDPQGKAVGQALHHMGFDEVRDVKIGKRIELIIDGTDEAQAKSRAEEMARKLLVNPNVESFRVNQASEKTP